MLKDIEVNLGVDTLHAYLANKLFPRAILQYLWRWSYIKYFIEEPKKFCQPQPQGDIIADTKEEITIPSRLDF